MDVCEFHVDGIFRSSSFIKFSLVLSIMSLPIHVSGTVAPTIQRLDTTVIAKYPSEWFSSNPSKKPSLHIRYHKDFDHAKQDLFLRLTGSHELTKDNALGYLYWFLSKKTVRLNETWKSYGVTIGEESQDINPFSLLDVRKTLLTPAEIVETTEIVDSNAEKWIALFLVGIYRYANTSNLDHKDKIRSALAKQLSNYQCPPDVVSAIQTVAPTSEPWLNTMDYRKAIAAIDMFFRKFPDEEMSILRIGTIISRFRDCAALQIFDYFCELYGFEERAEVLYWLYTDSLVSDINRLFKENEELGFSDSYFPYHVDLGLTVKSPYSSTLNPVIYTFCAFAGCYRADERSKLARYILTKDVTAVFTNAAIIGYAFNVSNRMSRKYLSTQEYRTQQSNRQLEESTAMQTDQDSTYEGTQI